MSLVKRFEDLNCWNEARILLKGIYKIISDGRLANDFETKNKLRRTALSVMNNLAYINEKTGNEIHLQIDKTRNLTLALIDYLCKKGK